MKKKTKDQQKQKDKINQLKEEFNKLSQQNAQMEDDYNKLGKEDRELVEKVLEEKSKIKQLQNDLDELDEKEQINIGITGMPGEEGDEEMHDELGNQQMQAKQEEIKEQKKKLMYLQLQRQVQQNVDRMVISEIETVCDKVISAHIEMLDDNNMNYIVIHSDKKAIFKLKSKSETFKDINEKIAQYFGLPLGKIFLKNQNDEILLSNMRVIDELFPLRTSKIKNQEPKIYVTFQKNMNTLEFILGQEKEKEMKKKQQEQFQKDKDREEDLQKKNIQKKEKDQQLKIMREQIIYDEKKQRFLLGMASTLMFLAFWVTHIFLAGYQYNIEQMYLFNAACTKAIFPNIDVEIPIVPYVFMSRPEMESYFLQQVNGQIQDSSDAIATKSHFYTLNYMIPYVKLTNVQATSQPCGSPTSNWISQNQQAILDQNNNNTNSSSSKQKLGYPFNDNCYATWLGNPISQDPIPDQNGTTTLNFTNSQSLVGIRGFMVNFDGSGFTKIVKMNYSDPNFYQNMFQQEVINQNWTRADSTIAIIQSFLVYNPNLYLLNEKKGIVEFLDAGGFISFDHDNLLINMRLYRDNTSQILSSFIIIVGFGLIIVSLIGIKKEEEDRIQAEKSRAQEEAELLKQQQLQENPDAGAAQQKPEAAKDKPDEQEKQEENDGQEKAQESDEPETRTFIQNVVFYKDLVVGSSIFQKVNFLMIFMVYFGQILKYIYDAYANTYLVNIATNNQYFDPTSLYYFNQVCMLIDSSIIIIGSISLLKYTSMFAPELLSIIKTINNFVTGTFKKTMTLILLVYVFFGFCSYYFFCYYQYGFFEFGYALLRSCIVFLGGFIINEQQILLSKESVDNLIRFNPFIMIFIMMLVINILIRQIIINIVAINMHNDYHKAKIEAKQEIDKKEQIFEQLTKDKVKKRYQEQLVKDAE